MFNSILFVCIGNICRSPTAEYLLRHKLAAKPQLVVRSAGLGALVDQPVEATAAELLLEQGIDPSGHKARQLRTDHLVKADLVLAMEPEMVRKIHRLAPQVSGKTFLLGKWQDSSPVADPYRKSREAFVHVYHQIDRYTDDWVKYL